MDETPTTQKSDFNLASHLIIRDFLGDDMLSSIRRICQPETCPGFLDSLLTKIIDDTGDIVIGLKRLTICSYGYLELPVVTLL